MCRNLHVNEICDKISCEITSCNQRHSRECRYYREYCRCKFNPCKFKHVLHLSQESDIGKLKNDMKKCNDQLEEFENQIKKLEQIIVKKEEEIDNLMKTNETEEKNLMKKKNILQRLEALEKLNNEKDTTIKFLSERLDSLESTLKQVNEDENVEKASNFVTCEYCDFHAKNDRGLKLHMKAKHEITKVEVSVFCKATEKYLSSDRDMYRKELETEIDVLEDIVDMDINSSNAFDYVGKFLPLKIVLRSRIPTQWQTNENFRKQIWDRINKRIVKGKISEDKDGK